MSRYVYPDLAALSIQDREPMMSACRMDEAEAMKALLPRAELEAEAATRVRFLARGLVRGMIKAQERQSGIGALLHEYDLSSEEGIALMCLAEALLRVPDKATADQLIQDKLSAAHWDAHLGKGQPFFVNVATWGLWISERIIDTEDRRHWLGGAVHRLLARAGAPLVRSAVRRAMVMLGDAFVLGRTIDEAMKRARPQEQAGYCYSYDMLGESARTEEDARRYFEAYRHAVHRIGDGVDLRVPLRERPGISVKLSALDARYEPGHESRLQGRLMPRILELCRLARDQGIPLCIDAEESWRLDLSLDVMEILIADSDLNAWDGLGMAVQAYQKRAWAQLGWLEQQAARHRRIVMVRLVKGAYWDTEIKDSQQQGLSDYPVFTRKAATDVSYLACARRLLHDSPHLYPQFATHNAQTVAAVMEMAGNKAYEFQRLHGMGEGLYGQLVERSDSGRLHCRIYAPVGSHETLLPYLVRRMLENGANTSFVHRLHEEHLEQLITDPVTTLKGYSTWRHPRIPLPAALYAPARRNSRGLDFAHRKTLHQLAADMNRIGARAPWNGGPVCRGRLRTGHGQGVYAPSDRGREIGRITFANDEDLETALAAAHQAWTAWDERPPAQRAAILDQVADLLEQHTTELMVLCVEETGKTLRDAQAEVREAVDFCRYYAAQVRERFIRPLSLPGITGECNELTLRGRGVFLCISPWNFPLAIFTGQVTAALGAGNAVIAKPAEQAGLVAVRATQLMHQAGVPSAVLHCLPGRGEEIGPKLVADARISGVAFTGSTATARLIHRGLAAREDGPIVPLIAETGGINAMVVDATALHEQVVMDILRSAFFSAGQRCSALRVLCVQESVADALLEMLQGAMDTLVVGDPHWLSTDVGPVIDDRALAALQAHDEEMRRKDRLLHRAHLSGGCERGSFMLPSLYQLDRLDELPGEVFGPMLHVLRWRTGELDGLIRQINATGYGLTLGIHSRIDAVAHQLARKVRTGNAYVNRDMVGAVVGSQPFGGEGLSGTGFKAGGPHYLLRFATERVLTVNTAAAGGNAVLLVMGEERDTGRGKGRI
ncbi:bifunctional proline dehydrogenase/L-glutamate gamma-semialdehyde dehydrogenase PutA [Ectothiorhodospira lacustris]|uniref:bifunctional proline dehydrogenase/L-glutamate gamma-semialdehyde dehydrogenase PutA n=1 Tax=Ectothiorhodospira lacustris TaxID=2899127 RepID=UPI001EE7E0EC|nr:bifunctional proline dehydrogenase/L-glutamate gamma-semialdehyde dehydrogenase PutA [Ectothiorhodospira lacustris]MCG5501366.1 bifunctional proline dehydrogenase/L-glutamate gamma-semialdehyde dehydrogenase PutA [Ectothiorhodospira lacustris]MCG5511254.1 bifunctional proline dehydrogenase/L-glutamate gamma-semialdehyde dehydrogenase PutA [Ectothiorhodospira lacustris]MCG5522930.1 bifunctional proline dehydrogenase/L-glutamate gamma-semialdehyde dehydrogenase PutA [Ectothiorhodospira lacustri